MQLYCIAQIQFRVRNFNVSENIQLNVNLLTRSYAPICLAGTFSVGKIMGSNVTSHK